LNKFKTKLPTDFSPKIPYNLVAEPALAGEVKLTIPRWRAILKIVQTHFAACGGEELPVKLEVSPQNFKTVKKNRGNNRFDPRFNRKKGFYQPQKV